MVTRNSPHGPPYARHGRNPAERADQRAHLVIGHTNKLRFGMVIGFGGANQNLLLTSRAQCPYLAA
jgi:hypothetical protein